MTNKEIERKADEITWRNFQVVDVREGEELKVDIISFAHTLVLQAYEEATRMACGHCLNGLRVEYRNGDYHHPAQGYWPEAHCAAGGIHALKDSLAVSP